MVVGCGKLTFKLHLIRYLDVSSCPVTDAGVKALCSNDYVGNETRRMGRCKFIHSLNLIYTKVTKEGIKVALENLKDLKTFQFPRSVQILAEIRRENLERVCFKTYSITQFECSDSLDDSGNSLPYEIGSLRLAATLCPSVTSVVIFLQTVMTDFELCGLLELKSLCEIRLIARENRSSQITFDGGVLPLLKAFGRSLLTLKLGLVNTCVNVRAIVELCPELQKLELDISSCRYSMISTKEGSSNNSANDITLKNLKDLSLCMHLGKWAGTDNSIEMFSSLLSSPRLTSLDVSSCDSFTDEVIQKFARRFPNLQSLIISHCRFISKKGIDFIFNEINPLSFLGVSNCEKIKEEDGDEWENKKWEKNLYVWIQVEPFFDEIGEMEEN